VGLSGQRLQRCGAARGGIPLPAAIQRSVKKYRSAFFLSRKNATFTFYFALCNNDNQLSTQKQLTMMKRTTILGLSLLLAGIVSVLPGRVQAASMAVLVVGLETDAASDAFAQGIRYEYTQKGYTLVDNDAVKAKLATMRQAYKDGQPVDTVGLAAWGKEHNIDFVQLVVEKGCDITIGSSTVSGREQLSQVVSCSTAKYTDRATYRTRFIPRLPDININLGTAFDEMVFVAGGVFEMGCKPGRDDNYVSCISNESPVHYVRVNNFHIGKYAVTQGLWKKVMGTLPSSIVDSLLGDDKPVVYVSWNDIMDTTAGFLKKLNAQTGKNYRLPTEAEWEYAARGCIGGIICESFDFSGSSTVGNVAWHYDNSNDTLQVVGQKPPNALGLYDMSGNVFEWCSDWYSASYYPSGTTADDPQDNPTGPTSGSYRLHHGGAWNFSAYRSRIADRSIDTPDKNFDYLGFRLV
jgi:formylglycine-generating enzyme required for sulfatase activity